MIIPKRSEHDLIEINIYFRVRVHESVRLLLIKCSNLVMCLQMRVFVLLELTANASLTLPNDKRALQFKLIF